MSDRIVKESGCNCRKRRKRDEEVSLEIANARLTICAGCCQFNNNCMLMPNKELAVEVKKLVSPCPLGLHK